MKTLSKLKLSDVQKLNNDEMKLLEGGIPASDYCRQIKENYNNNSNSWSSGALDGFWYGWNTYCS